MSPKPEKSPLLALIVEDEAELATYLSRALEELNCRVLTASDGVEALGFLAKNPEIRLIVLDLGLPRLDGLGFLQQTVQLSPNAAIIVSTGFAAKLSEEERAKFPIVAVLNKPYTLETFINASRKALAEPGEMGRN